MADGASDNPPSPSTLSLVAKFGARSFPLSVPSDSTVKDLKLQPFTNVLPRGQKLIFKGESSYIKLLYRKFLFTSLSNDIPLYHKDGTITSNTCTTSKSGSVLSKYSSPIKPEVHMRKSHSERWLVAGVVALSGYHLKVVPEEVWACGAAVPVWACGAAVRLTTLSSVIGSLASLRELHIAKNNLISLPEELRFLSGLQVLKAGSNRLSSLPPCIVDCVSLIEAYFSSNYLVELPDTLSNLHNLKTLIPANNGLKNLPTAIFKSCLQLSNLDLHRTEITVDQLHEFVEWEEFDERRKAKLQKQLDFRVGFNSKLDEGADKDNVLGEVPWCWPA